MPADLTGLQPEFRQRFEKLLTACSDRGVTMRPTEAVRDPWTQAKYWRQSRSSEQIAAKIAQLRNAGANFLATVIDSVGPQSGDPVTNSIPGMSWHQWGEAVDCVWIVGGHAVWDENVVIDGENGFRVYAEEATKLMLTPGGLWPHFKDWPHVQARVAPSPVSSGLTLLQVNQAMQDRWPQPH